MDLIFYYRKSTLIKFNEETNNRKADIDKLRVSLLVEIKAQSEKRDVEIESLFIRFNDRFDEWGKFVTQELIDLAKGAKK